ncbi:MAG: hypothetical protein WAN36_05540 [Calditrichia bacterium]
MYQNFKNIEHELSRVSVLNRKVGSEFIISKKYKDDREWWILGYLCILLRKAGVEFPHFAIKKNEKNPPDFITFDHYRKIFRPIEVSEVIAPCRKRTQEYRNTKVFRNLQEFEFENIVQIPNPWESLIERLNKKFLKKYGSNSWLVLYHNMSYSVISSSGYWHHTLLYNAKNWKNNGKVDFSNFEGEKVFVINNNCNSMVELFPNFEVVIS